MIEILVVSSTLLWVLLIFLSIVGYALLKQVGILYDRIAPAGALSVNSILQAGDRSPKVSAPSIDRDIVEIGTVSNAGRSTFLFFLSPNCPICKSLLPTLKHVAKNESDWLDIIFVSDGASNHGSLIKQFKLEQFTYVVSEQVGVSFGVSKLPYGVLIDPSGRIASLGIVNSREHIDSLFEAKEREVASIQEFIKVREQRFNSE